MSHICLGDGEDAVHGGLLDVAVWLQTAVQAIQVKRYKADHRQPQQQHVAGLPRLKCTIKSHNRFQQRVWILISVQRQLRRFYSILLDIFMSAGMLEFELFKMMSKASWKECSFMMRKSCLHFHVLCFAFSCGALEMCGQSDLVLNGILSGEHVQHGLNIRNLMRKVMHEDFITSDLQRGKNTPLTHNLESRLNV